MTHTDTGTPDTTERTHSKEQQPISTLLRTAAAHAVPVVRGIRDDQLTIPTPCTEYDVRQLLNHLVHVVVEFQQLAAKQNADFTGETPDRIAEPGWRDRFAEETDRLIAAWAEPGAEEGTAGQMDLPARVVGAMALLDLTVHAWDLARATGQEYDRHGPSAEVLAGLNEFATEMAPTARQYGVIGEPAEVPEGATEFERLLALVGRSPHWKP
ncbi:TIGR03086 family protein [Streptomyces triticagri]|uniref:TIGR03086 family protein n=1 Tax=Streptomyces triticagri TaxID=2293568 RepID=A0A372MBM3_9ACTN|nr:TIGR03086 family metal-binding protein [Streptomyces triticagri]RFU87793.1 TIGR03086 family protein [Streptomyces triticagri]